MLNIQDLESMFNDYLDNHYDKWIIDDLTFYPSEILQAFQNLYDTLFKRYIDTLDLTYIKLDDNDGYYKLNTLLNEDY